MRECSKKKEQAVTALQQQIIPSPPPLLMLSMAFDLWVYSDDFENVNSNDGGEFDLKLE